MVDVGFVVVAGDKIAAGSNIAGDVRAPAGIDAAGRSLCALGRRAPSIARASWLSRRRAL